MTTFQVQFELPVDNPVDNVRMKRKKKVLTFYVPINLPNAHNIGLRQLLDLSSNFRESHVIHST